MEATTVAPYGRNRQPFSLNFPPPSDALCLLGCDRHIRGIFPEIVVWWGNVE
jgi:hypothetical protein